MTEFDPKLIVIHGQARLEKVEDLLKDCTKYNIKIVTAESLTAGGITHLLTELSGSSNMLDSGYVVYNDEAKARMLGVNELTLENYSAVSAPVAKQMAEGALDRSKAKVSVAVTGYSDATGDPSRDIVGGTVFIAVAYKGINSWEFTTEVNQHQFSQNRHECREQTIDAAIDALTRVIEIVKTQEIGMSR